MPSPSPAPPQPCWASVFPLPKALRVSPSFGCPRQGGGGGKGISQPQSRVFAQRLWLQGGHSGRGSLVQPCEVAWAKRPYTSGQGFFSSWAAAEAILEGEAPSKGSWGHTVPPPQNGTCTGMQGKGSPLSLASRNTWDVGTLLSSMTLSSLFLLLFPLSQLHVPLPCASGSHHISCHDRKLGRKAKARGHCQCGCCITDTPQLT